MPPSTLQGVRAALIDLSGTMFVGSTLCPGALNALRKLKEENYPFRFVTNTSKESTSSLLQRMHEMGLIVDESQVFTAVSAARAVVDQRGLKPLCLLQPDAASEVLSAVTEVSSDGRARNAVVVGLSPNHFNYEDLNEAFRILKSDPQAQLIACNKSRYMQGKDGLRMGAGAFVAALEFAAGRTADVVVGKPSQKFFMAAIASLDADLQPSEVIMIGDDSHDDVYGAQEAGLLGALVKTGKYRDGDELGCEGRKPDVVVENVGVIVDELLGI